LESLPEIRNRLPECLKGFMDKIQTAGASIAWNLSDEDNVNNTFEWCLQKKKVDIVVSLDNDTTEQAVDYLQAQKQIKFQLYGIGCSEKNVYYLDKGEIRALIVPNEFNIGYLSVAAIAGQLREPLSSAKTEEIGFLTITKENLYDEENQKILFPIVQ